MFREKQGINVHISHRVVGLFPNEWTIQVHDLIKDKEFSIQYDELMLATGARPFRPELDGIDSENIYDVNSVVNGTRLKEALAKDRPASVVVVGGGYIGIEVVEALHLLGIKVTLLQRGKQIMSAVDSDIAEVLTQAMIEDGIDVRLNEGLVGFEYSGGRVTAVVTNMGRIPTDCVVLGLGVLPRSELAQDAGIILGPKGTIEVNNRQQTSVSGVWAGGDCAQAMNVVSGEPGFYAMGTIANKQGRVAGLNLGGKDAIFPGVVGTAITKFNQMECARTGLGEKELESLGIEYVVGKVDGVTKPRYYPGSAMMKVKVYAERGSGKMLRAQIVGGPGAGKRIDTAATALHAGFSMDDMLYLDLAYAPPFSGVWEPLVIAARLAEKQI